MKNILLFGLLIIGVVAFGQEDLHRKALQVTGFINGNKVLIRWAPTEPIAWMQGNKNGYKVFRKTVMRDGKVLDKQDSILLKAVKPMPIVAWKPFADSSHFAVAAEAIYGSGFEVTAQSNGFFDMINKSREQESRFTMGLICADQSFTVACMMGLGLVDSTCLKNETYLYGVVANGSQPTESFTASYCLIDFKTGNFLPKPFGIEYQTKQNLVTMLIPYHPFKGVYTNYELQRSNDGKHFVTVKGKSYFSASTTTDDPTYSVYNDSVKLDASTFYYRVRGRTPFDTCGTYSDIIPIKIMPSLDGEPWITGVNEIGKGQIRLTWNTPEYISENLKGFKVMSSESYQGPYETVNNSVIPFDARFYTLSTPSSFAYFKVAAIDQFDRSYMSSPRLYQAVDSIPPSVPSGLVGVFDTTGMVHIRWQRGNERDLLGYQVLYSSDSAQNYSLLGKGIIFDSTYSATFPTKDVLSAKLYFKLVALDMRYNTSKSSAPIGLIKPDKIPPSSPFVMVQSDSLGKQQVFIAPSHVLDIMQHQICFQPIDEVNSPVVLFKGAIKRDTTFIINQNLGKGYLYCVAEDLTGLKGYSNKVLLITSEDKSTLIFRALAKSQIDKGCVELIWDDTPIKGSIMIYRKDDKIGYRLISTVNSRQREFVDRGVAVNTVYTYKLIVTLKNGKMVNKIIDIRYK